ncbi:MAG: threonine/serine exporter family protein [Lachnospiraceae bacterium]
MSEISKINDEEMNCCLFAIMDIGELLLMHGAEVSRVEDTITRLCSAYGFDRSDVFTITSSIVVTAMTSDGKAITQTRRIKERDTDLGKVAQVNALSRKLCSEPVALADFRKQIQEIKNTKPASGLLTLSMYMLISASLSVFFGGMWMDSLAAAISGSVLFAALRGSAVLKLNSIIQNMICSAITAVSVVLLVKAGIGIHADKIMIGNIMLVIPGIQLTTSLRDMINGDMISGLLNMSEALLKAIAVAVGFAVVLLIGGGG